MPLNSEWKELTELMFIIKIYFYTKWLPHVLLCRMNNYFFPFWFYFKFMPQWQHTWKPCCIQLIFLLLLLVCIWEARFALPTSCVCVCVFFFFSAFCIIHETWTVHLCMCVWEARFVLSTSCVCVFLFLFLVPLPLAFMHVNSATRMNSNFFYCFQFSVK